MLIIQNVMKEKVEGIYTTNIVKLNKKFRFEAKW